MKLYFFRHGQAEDSQGPEFDDFARQLTKKGVERTQAAGEALVKLGVKLTRLYSSPRVRARQTADTLAKELGVPVIVRDELNFGFNVQHIPTLIADLKDSDEVMFVGHEPDFSIAVSNLIGHADVVMKKGGVARVDISARDPLKGELVWLLAPKVLDGMGDD